MSLKTTHTFAICAYGESPFLEECIQSVLSQTLPTQVIMVTATPNNHIETLAERYQIPLFVKDGKPGIASDWNYAVEKSEGDLVTIAHQDDIYEKDYAASLEKAVSTSDDLLIFFTNYGELRDGTRVNDNALLNTKRTMLFLLKNGRFKNSRLIRRRILAFGSAICCPSVTINKALISLPLFQDNMKCDLDWQAWELLSKQRGAFYYDPSILMYHRIHQDSETTHLIKDNTRTLEDLEMFGKFWPKPLAKIINRVYSSSQNSNAE